jgi:hypothetical protein
MMSMAGPLGVLLAAPAASTTEFEDDVNGAPPMGRCRWVRQRPPLRFKTMSMAGPWGVLPVGPVASATEF